MTPEIPTQSLLKLDFEVGRVNDQSMTMVVLHNNQKKVYSKLDEKFSVEIAITFPTTVKLILLGKKNTDTVFDENQNVVQDKFIKLDKLAVDNLRCNALYLKNKTKLTTTDNQVVYDNYWGSNGEVALEFDQQNSVFWALETGSFKP
jgi:hypothetical protein